MRGAQSQGGDLSPRVYALLVGLIYALAVGLRAWRYICGDLSPENAVMGKVARDWLFGETPLFFYGQSHMGTWDTLLSAPLIALFGPSAWIINLWPPILSLGVMYFCHRMLVRVLPPAGVLAGLCYMAVPPAYWLFYSGYAQTHNTMCIMLEALLMLLTAKFWESDDPGLWLYILLGLIPGAGFYVNFQMGSAILPCALFILLFCWRKLKPLKVAATLAMTLLGLAPMIVFNLDKGGGEHLGILGALGWRYFEVAWQPFLGNSLPLLLGFTRPAAAIPGAGQNLSWGLGPLALIMLLGALLLLTTGMAKQKRIAWLPVMLGAANLGIVLFSSYSRVLGGFHQAYLFTLYLMFPFAFGAFCQFVFRQKAAPILALSVLLMILHASNYSSFMVHGFRLFEEPFHISRMESTYLNQVEALREHGVKAVYTRPASYLSFYGQRDPLVVNPYNEGKARDSFLADSELNPLFWRIDLRASMNLLGLEYETLKLGGHTGYWNFKPPQGADILLDLPRARAVTLNGSVLGRALTDRDVNSMFSTLGKARAGQGFVLDLGQSLEVAGLSLVPNKYNDSPAGLLVEAAGEDRVFQTIREIRGYWGPFYMSGPHPVLKARHPRTDCYFAPRKLRYLRLTHLGASHSYWTVREILLFGPDGSQPAEPPWRKSLDRALALVGQKDLSTVYADTWAAGALKHKYPQLEIIAGNTGQDDYGHNHPPLNQDWMLKAEPASALVVEPKYSADIMRRLAQASIPADLQKLGALDFITLESPARGKTVPIEEIGSNLNPESARGLMTPEHCRWTSGKPQDHSAYLELDLGEPLELGALVLRNPNHPDDYARELTLQISLDGENWRDAPIWQSLPLCFGGQTLFTKPGGVNWYGFPQGLKARYLRLSPKGDGGPFWWSVESVEVFLPKEPGSLGAPLRK